MPPSPEVFLLSGCPQPDGGPDDDPEAVGERGGAADDGEHGESLVPQQGSVSGHQAVNRRAVGGHQARGVDAVLREDPDQEHSGEPADAVGRRDGEGVVEAPDLLGRDAGEIAGGGADGADRDGGQRADVARGRRDGG